MFWNNTGLSFCVLYKALQCFLTALRRNPKPLLGATGGNRLLIFLLFPRLGPLLLQLTNHCILTELLLVMPTLHVSCCLRETIPPESQGQSISPLTLVLNNSFCFKFMCLLFCETSTKLFCIVNMGVVNVVLRLSCSWEVLVLWAWWLSYKDQEQTV